MLEYALQYLRRGWSIFPVNAAAKIPLVKWGQYQDRLPTEEEVRQWWAKWPDADIGLATGPLSGVAVLDLEHEGLAQIGMTANTMALTGKGKHGFFKFTEGLRNKSALSKIKGYDIRAEGGYAVLPPSVHANGKRYTWAIGPMPELLPFPSEVLSDIGEAKKVEAAKPEGWIAEALGGLSEDSHNRNSTFASAVGKLHYHGLDKVSIWALLLPYAKRCTFPEAELNVVIQSVSKYSGGSVASEALLGDAGIESFLADAKDVEWISKPVLPKEGIGFIVGLPGSYKTWALGDLAVECARGSGLWLGLFPVAQTRVLTIDQERPLSEAQRRMKSVMAAKGVSVGDLKGKLFARAGTTMRLNLDASFRPFQALVRSIQPGLIILDSLSTIMQGSINDDTVVRATMENLKLIRDELKCCIVIVHHESKGAYGDMVIKEEPSLSRIKGSSCIEEAADFAFVVRRYDPTTCTMHHVKNNPGTRISTFPIHVDDVPNGVRVYGEMGGK